MKPSVAAIVLTRDEALHLTRALQSIEPFCRKCYVVDSGSTDCTLEIAHRAGATVLHHAFKNQADQFQWALDNIAIEEDWVLRIDADEIVEPDLANRIQFELPHLSPNVVGVTFDRKHVFMGRWIKHGGRYPLRMLRLFRRGHGAIEQRWMDEHIIVRGGQTIHFIGGFVDNNLRDLSAFIAKHNEYATREAVDQLIRRHRLMPTDDVMTTHPSSAQAARKRQIKERVYGRMPIWLGPLAYFMFRYVGQLGFLDGREGLIYHVLQGFWYRFLVAAKIEELERAISGRDRDAQIHELQQRTRLILTSSTASSPSAS